MCAGSSGNHAKSVGEQGFADLDMPLTILGMTLMMMMPQTVIMNDPEARHWYLTLAGGKRLQYRVHIDSWN